MRATLNGFFELRLDHIGQGAATLSPDGTITRANDRLARMVGFSSVELLGTKLLELTAPDDRHLIGDLTSAAPAYACQAELRLRRADQSFVSAVVTMAPRADASVLCFVTDLGEHKRRIEAEDRQSKFLGMLAHEFRNMLAPIKNSAEVLRRQADPQSLGLAEIIDRQVGRMLQLVDDLKKINPRD